jgi:hypothetical protein
MTDDEGNIARYANGKEMTVADFARDKGIDLQVLQNKVIEGGELTEIEK